MKQQVPQCSMISVGGCLGYWGRGQADPRDAWFRVSGFGV